MARRREREDEDIRRRQKDEENWEEEEEKRTFGGLDSLKSRGLDGVRGSEGLELVAQALVQEIRAVPQVEMVAWEERVMEAATQAELSESPLLPLLSPSLLPLTPPIPSSSLPLSSPPLSRFSPPLLL